MEKTIAFMQEISDNDKKEVNGGNALTIIIGPLVSMLLPKVFNEIIKE